MNKIPVVVQDGSRFYRYAKVDWLDSGNGIMVFLSATAEKTSRHSDGAVYDGQVGGGVPRTKSFKVPFSTITQEIIKSVPIPSDLTYITKPYSSGPPKNALIFPAAVLQSTGSFVAEVVATPQATATLAQWNAMPGTVSSQTYSDNRRGQTLILTVVQGLSSGVSSSGTA